MGIVKNSARELIKVKAKKSQAKQTQENSMICCIEVRFTKSLLLIDDSTTVLFQPFFSLSNVTKTNWSFLLCQSRDLSLHKAFHKDKRLSLALQMNGNQNFTHKWSQEAAHTLFLCILIRHYHTTHTSSYSLLDYLFRGTCEALTSIGVLL